MVQYDERIQYDDLLACEYSSLFDCFFEISRPACDYYYPTNDGDYLVCTIHSTETKCTLLSHELELDFIEDAIDAARLNAAHARDPFVDALYYDESNLPF